MNTKLPPFKNGEHNSKSASTNDRVITPLKLYLNWREVFPAEITEESNIRQISLIKPRF